MAGQYRGGLQYSVDNNLPDEHAQRATTYSGVRWDW